MLLKVAIGRFNNDDISRDYLSFVLKSFIEIIIVKHTLSVSDRTVAQNYWGHQLRCRRFSFLFNLNNKLSSLTILKKEGQEIRVSTTALVLVCVNFPSASLYGWSCNNQVSYR